MSNSGPTSETTGNIAIASAIVSTSFLPLNSSRAIAYAASVAMMTESSVAIRLMPIELMIARRNWSFVQDVVCSCASPRCHRRRGRSPGCRR